MISFADCRISGRETDATFLRTYAPLPKTLLAILHLILLISLGPRDWTGAIVFALLPYLLAPAAGLAPGKILLRALPALPFVCCAGLANCFFDRVPVEIFRGVTVSGGILSFAVLTFKTLGSAGTALLLAGSTPLSELTGALTTLRVPCVLILQIQLLFRYLPLVSEEAHNISRAYFLRNPDKKIMPVRDWGMAAGRLFLRTVERGEGIYQAMQCRLFSAREKLPPARKASLFEWGIFLAASGLLLAGRSLL